MNMKRRLFTIMAGIAMLVAIPSTAGAACLSGSGNSTSSQLPVHFQLRNDVGPIGCKGIIAYRYYFHGRGFGPYIFRGYC